MENAPTVKAAEDVFQIMDRLDDQLIEAELQNRVINTWSYSFTGSDGRLQEGLSKVGVDEACVEMSKRGYIIREGEIAMRQDPTNAQYILFQVPASLIRITAEGQEVLMDVVNGAKRQWIKMKLKNGSIVDDTFWYEKGAMKAARNARSRLIPSETKTTILMLAKEKGRSRNIGSNKKPPLKPPKKASQDSEKGSPVKDKDEDIPEDTQKEKDRELRGKLKEYAKMDNDVYFEVLDSHSAKNAEDVIKYPPDAQEAILHDLAVKFKMKL